MQEIILNLDNIFLIILIVIFGIYAIFFLRKSRNLELLEQKRFFFGLFAFFLGWSLTNLIFLFAYSYPELHPLFATLWKVAAIVGIAALLSIIIVIEKYAVPKSKFLFSIITLIGLVLVIILPIQGTEISGARLASYIFLPVGAASIALLYLYLIIKLTGKPKQETGIIFMGLLLIIIGYILDTELLSGMLLPPLDILDSLLMICGGMIVTIMYYRRE